MSSDSTIPCEPPTTPPDHGDDDGELRAYLARVREGDWLSAVRVLSYTGGSL